jgi:colicin import membrane protein
MANLPTKVEPGRNETRSPYFSKPGISENPPQKNHFFKFFLGRLFIEKKPPFGDRSAGGRMREKVSPVLPELRSAMNRNGNSRRIEQPDPFRFGWRYVQQIGRNGAKQRVRVPLTLDDVLHPQEGDHIPDDSQQGRDCNYLYGVLKWRVADNPHAVAFTDCLINWGVRGLRNHSPDISVFDGVADPQRIWRTFAVAREGARPLLVIEIVSPDAHDRQARDNDVVTKVREYYRAGVPLYVLVDQEGVDGPRRIVGHRRGAHKYVRLPLDERGRVRLSPVRLRMGLHEERVVCWDTDSDEEIPDFADAMARIRELEARGRNGG